MDERLVKSSNDVPNNDWKEINTNKKNIISSKSRKTISEPNSLELGEMKERIIKKEIRLSEWHNSGGCFSCLNGRCHFSEENHSIPYIKELSIVFKNPTTIFGMYDAIKKAGFNWNNIQCTYTVCPFVYSNRGCKNCKENRTKTFIFKNQEITICYPPIESVKYKLTIGMHIDFIIKLNSKGYDVTVFSINQKKDERLSDERVKNEYLISSKFDGIQNDERDYDFIEKAVENNINNNENFPALNGITHSFTIPENISNNETFSNLIKKSILDEELINYEEEKNHKIYEEEKIKNEDFISLNKLKLLELENESLKNDKILLNQKIYMLENEISKLNYVKDKFSKYEEMFKNKKTIESRVTQQFLNTNYSEYIIY
jgi:hypothetical protein